ncbi:methyl-accepting chemotaxis protein [uncultured Pseudodesulfovibrio sp.]|uniref:methyl-accepting chemotaxis protein n=1 Tax=uncultured Pseudodesulfovibrio sp. TaxID=2035858 RepID=UPI0029C648F1|nr:methyl-accepting chemotaxis protein [uncultured Pseudodesulfovibrio sp.]
MKLSTKLSLGFGGLLALLLVLAGVSFWALNSSSEGFTSYRGMARDTNLSGRLQANMLMVRMNVKDFIITGSDKDIQQYDEYFGKMRGFMKTAQDEIQKPERARLVDSAGEKVSDYGKYFNQIKQLRTERDILVNNVLNVQGPQMEKNLTSILTSAQRDNDMEAAFRSGLALRNLLLARLYVIKFLDDNSQASIDRVHKETEALVEEMKILDASLQNPERRKLLQESVGLAKTYTEAFDKLTGIIFSRNEIITGKLDVIGPAIAKDVEEVKLSVMADQDQLGPALQAVNAQAMTSLVSLSTIALLVAVLTTLFIIRSIMKQLGKDPADLADIAKTISEGNLTLDFDQNAAGVYGHMRTMAGQLISVVGCVRDGSTNVASGSEQLSSSAQALSQGTTEQAASIQEVSASIQQMSSNIQQNTQNAVATEEIASKSASEADESGTAVSETVSAMKHIAEKISIIEEIARQTNLLALNAAIEAARAGNHGKGFAVVAAEVRKLAERSGVAAGEISELSDSTVSVAEKAGQLLEELVPNIKKTADLVREISAASNEQNTGAEQIGRAVTQLDTVVQQNAAAAEQMASTSEELTGQSCQLEQTIAFFNVDGNGNGNGRWKEDSQNQVRVVQPAPQALSSEDSRDVPGLELALDTV